MKRTLWMVLLTFIFGAGTNSSRAETAKTSPKSAVPSSTAVATPTQAPLSYSPAPKAKLPAGRNRIYASFGIPHSVTYDPVPDGIWMGGLDFSVGYEISLTPQVSTFWEIDMATADVNRTVFNFGPNKTAATFMSLIGGVKGSMLPQNPVSPYFTAGIGATHLQIQELLVPDLPAGFYDPLSFPPLDILDVDRWRFLFRAGIGLDVRCESDLLAFFEVQLYDMDTRHIFAGDDDVVLTVAKTGLRLEL